MSGSPGASSGPADLGLTLTRKYSRTNQERIDNILETARARSIAMANTSDPALASLSRQSPRSPNYLYMQSPDSSPEASRKTGPLEGITAETESSADEETSIVRRESRRSNTRDYMSTAASTSLKSRHDSQTSTRRAVQIPPQNTEAVQSEVSTAAEDSKERNSPSWWKRNISDKYGSIELENTGSVARDHLALERTFLAWLRTSVGFASIGIAITQLFRLNASLGSDPQGSFMHLRQLGKPLGATFIGISILVLFVGFHRYFECQHWIIQGRFPASRGSIALIALIALIVMVASLVVVLVIAPTSFEK